MSDPLAVTIIPNGPLKVSGASSAQFCGEPLPVGGDLYLCRCGNSANAPFCDGAHARTGFVGESEAPPAQQVHTWEGRTIRTFFNKATCMHVFYCKPLKALRAAELAGDDGAAGEIARVVGTCPSGALSFEYKPEAESAGLPAGETCIDIREGGEVRLQVDFQINAPMQERQASNRATLCRCGMSKNKPWCDGRHKGRKDFR